GLDWTIPVLVSRLRGGRLLVRHDLAGRVVSGDIAITPEAAHGALADRIADPGTIRRRQVPVLLLPRDFANLLGRDAEVAAALSDLGGAGLTEFSGPAGIGKTSILRHIANRAEDLVKHGVLYVPGAAEQVHDVLQYVF